MHCTKTNSLSCMHCSLNDHKGDFHTAATQAHFCIRITAATLTSRKSSEQDLFG